MNNEYITEEDRVLTRVTLEVDGKKFTVESMYSDESVLELGMNCICAYLPDIGVSEGYLCDMISSLLCGSQVLYDPKVSISANFKFTMDQYGKRNIVADKSGYNVIISILKGFVSCSVLATWSADNVTSFLKEWEDDHRYEDDAVYGDGEDVEPVDNTENKINDTDE